MCCYSLEKGYTSDVFHEVSQMQPSHEFKTRSLPCLRTCASSMGSQLTRRLVWQDTYRARRAPEWFTLWTGDGQPSLARSRSTAHNNDDKANSPLTTEDGVTGRKGKRQRPPSRECRKMDRAAEWREIVISWANWLNTDDKNRKAVSKNSRQQYKPSPPTTWRDYQGMLVHARSNNC